MAEGFEDNLQVCAGQSAEVSVSSQCDVMNPDDQTVGQQHVANGQIDSAVEHQVSSPPKMEPESHPHSQSLSLLQGTKRGETRGMRLPHPAAIPKKRSSWPPLGPKLEVSRNMRITNIRYGQIVFMAVATVLILYMFLLVQFNLRASCGKGNLDRSKEYFHLWFQKTVFKHNWEDIHCRRKHANETTVEESWIPELAKQLNLDAPGTSVFDSNTGCNEWLKLLRKRYPKLKIGGAHVDQYAVEYAKRLFNDTPSTFGTISSDGKLNFLPNGMQFVHAINYGGLKDLGNKEMQCNLVRDLLRILKPGGSMYLGHNIEENECRVLHKYADVALPGCYWSEMCLKDQTDIAEIYYIKEKDLFGAHSQIDDCYTAVFIHKKVIRSRGRDGHENPAPKYERHEKMYYCTTQNAITGKIASNIQELTKHVLKPDVVFPGSIYQGYKLAKNFHKMKENISHILSDSN